MSTSTTAGAMRGKLSILGLELQAVIKDRYQESDNFDVVHGLPALASPADCRAERRQALRAAG